MSKKIEQFFATCPRGLEAMLGEELRELGAQSIAPTYGGVAFSGEYELCYRANLHSRLASRVLLRVGGGEYGDEEDIYQGALSFDWPTMFSVDKTIVVKMTAQKAPLKSLEFTTLRIKDAICDRFREATGERPNVDIREPDVRIHVFLTATECTLYLDTSGQSLFKRGLRKQAGAAPLNENLAAGMVKLSGWQVGEPFFDPMCGSGTILMEAALVALNIAPGSHRDFGFEKLTRFDAKVWLPIKQAALDAQLPATQLPIFGRDMFGDSLRDALVNLEAAGLADVIQLKQGNVIEVPAPADHGVIVTNPPYGIRIGEQSELAEFYPELGNWLKQKCTGWNAYILSADMNLPKLIRLNATKRTPLFNGALECRLFEYKIVAGSARK
ncbi:MAG: class I SAM-dependent RNA methyltransferase [Sulfuriferula sp.]|nr:class I SAM-dependent RNA methyltransferase [Sulfuriferula sp.]